MALAIFLGASGLNQFAANPWVNLGITALFLGFALSLFGTVNLTLPSSMVTKAVSAERGHGQFVGTLLMGFAFTLTSFTCTAPFIGSLLVVAATGDWQWPLAGMLAFSSVFALPFVILAVVPQRLAQGASAQLRRVGVTEHGDDLVDEAKIVLREHPERISRRVREIGLRQVELDVPGVLFRTFGVEAAARRENRFRRGFARGSTPGRGGRLDRRGDGRGGFRRRHAAGHEDVFHLDRRHTIGRGKVQRAVVGKECRQFSMMGIVGDGCGSRGVASRIGIIRRRGERGKRSQRRKVPGGK